MEYTDARAHRQQRRGINNEANLRLLPSMAKVKGKPACVVAAGQLCLCACVCMYVGGACFDAFSKAFKRMTG